MSGTVRPMYVMRRVTNRSDAALIALLCTVLCATSILQGDWIPAAFMSIAVIANIVHVIKVWDAPTDKEVLDEIRRRASEMNR